jgi:hypothetical protein
MVVEKSLPVRFIHSRLIVCIGVLLGEDSNLESGFPSLDAFFKDDLTIGIAASCWPCYVEVRPLPSPINFPP